MCHDSKFPRSRSFHSGTPHIADLLKSVRAVGPNVQTNSLLSDRGSVTVDARTNTLLIQDMAGKVLEVRKLISQLDRPVKQATTSVKVDGLGKE